jgi:hypothetical protein
MSKASLWGVVRAVVPTAADRSIGLVGSYCLTAMMTRPANMNSGAQFFNAALTGPGIRQAGHAA